MAAKWIRSLTAGRVALGSGSRQDIHTHFHSHMKRADVPYEVKTTFDAAGLFVGASISYVLDPGPTWESVSR